MMGCVGMVFYSDRLLDAVMKLANIKVAAVMAKAPSQKLSV
jgi:hypothetical protein